MNSLFLFLAAFIWGVAFVAQSAGGDIVGPYTFGCIRSFLGVLILLPVILYRDKKGISLDVKESLLETGLSDEEIRANKKARNKTMWIGGICCGLALCVSSNLQQMGLYFGASSGKAGFLTACYILLVPILGIFLKKKCSWNVWVSVVVALAGLYLLCINGEFTVAFSDILLLLCALGFSVQIMLVDNYSPKVDGVKLSCIQFLVMGIITAVPMFFVEMRSLENINAVWLPALSSMAAWIALGYAGFMSNGVAYTFQILGQRGTNPAVASLIMSLESTFSVLAGWVILKEYLSAKELLGCLFIFFAVMFSQIPFDTMLKKSKVAE